MMQAYRYEKPDDQLKLRTLLIPEPQAGEVLIAVAVAAVKGAVAYGFDIDTKNFEDAQVYGATSCHLRLRSLTGRLGV
jgi:hypothetical protein